MLSIIARFYHWLHPVFSSTRIEPSNVEIITHFLRSLDLVPNVIRLNPRTPFGFPLESDPDVADMVTRRWAEYGLADSKLDGDDPNLFGYGIN